MGAEVELLRAIVASIIAFGLFGLTNAVAQPLAQSIQTMELHYQRLESHQRRLEQRLAEQSQRIRRLKAQRPSVGRDVQLRSALRDSKQLSDRLMRLQSQHHALRGQLVNAYGRALSGPARRTDRRKWTKRLAILRLQGAPSRSGTLVLNARAGELDSAEDLEASADLLRDSSDKLARQIKSLHLQIVATRRRAQLRRHAQAADDNPFVENAPRRLGRSVAVSGLQVKSGSSEADNAAGAAAGRGANSNSSAAEPAPSADYPGSSQLTGAPSTGASESGGQPSSPQPSQPAAAPEPTVRTVPDPADFDQVQRALRTADPATRLRLLERAQSRLQQLARDLRKREQQLRSRAEKQRRNPNN